MEIRHAVTGTAAAAMLLVGVSTATAHADSYVINEDVTCHIYEQVELQGSPAHDYMRWYTAGSSNGCTAGIWRSSDKGKTWGWAEYRTVKTAGTDNSDWYYDGPNYLAQVIVYTQTGIQVNGQVN
jgi:hypothetical protein